MQLVVLKKALQLELDVAGNNLGNFCLELTSKVFSCAQKVKVSSCVRSVVLYGGETSAVKEEDFVKLERNDMMVV